MEVNKKASHSFNTNERQFQHQDKDKYNFQKKQVFDCFYNGCYTMKEVDVKTSIMRENLCRYVAELKNDNLIYPIRKRICTVTKHLATEYTTNYSLIKL